jgi:hypothetical protein
VIFSSPLRVLAKLGFLLGLVSSVCGCAYTYLDEAGAMHFVGLAVVTIPASGSRDNEGARLVRVRNIGLSIVSAEIASSISLGFNADTVAVIYNNACVYLGDSRALWTD